MPDHPPFLVRGESPLPLATTAGLIGGYRWVEHALFTLLGGWVGEVGIPEVQVSLDSQSGRHAWHAELWAERLPVTEAINAETLTVAPEPAGAVLEALVAGTGEVGPPGVLPRLAGLYRVVLPRLIETYERHLSVTSSATDAPVVRALRLVLADEIEDWQAGERLVQRLVSRPHDVAAVYRFLERLETLAVASGVASGLVELPAAVPVR